MEVAVVNDESRRGRRRSKLVVDFGSKETTQINDALHEWNTRRREKRFDECEKEGGVGRKIIFNENGGEKVVDGEMNGEGKGLLVEEELKGR